MHSVRPALKVAPVICLLWLAVLACELSNPTPAAWSLTPTALARAGTATALAATISAAGAHPQVPTNTPYLAPAGATPTSASLTSFGPWLLYPSPDGLALIVRNPDGASPVRFDIPPLAVPLDLQDGAAPRGGLLAFRAGGLQDEQGPGLYLLDIPQKKVTLITPLLSASLLQKARTATGGGATETALAIQAPHNLSWSPDSRYLAFIAAIDGISADLYVYDNRLKKVTRLTTGSNQAATPNWSPNNAWIITQEYDYTASTTGMRVAAVWATSISSELTVKIYSPPAESIGEVFAGWISDSSLVSYSLNKQAGFNLRKIDVEHLRVTDILPGSLSAAVVDPKSKTLAVSFAEAGSSQNEYAPGLVLISGEGLDIHLVRPGVWSGLRWLPDAQRFSAQSVEGTLFTDLDGKYIVESRDRQAAPAPNNTWLVGYGSQPGQPGPGVRLYQMGGELLQAVSADPADFVLWQPDSLGFFYMGPGGLFHVPFPGLKPEQIDTTSASQPELFWIAGP